MEICNEILHNDIDSINHFILRGRAKFLLQDFKGAYEDYSIALQIDPENHSALHYRSIIPDKEEWIILYQENGKTKFHKDYDKRLQKMNKDTDYSQSVKDKQLASKYNQDYNAKYYITIKIPEEIPYPIPTVRAGEMLNTSCEYQIPDSHPRPMYESRFDKIFNKKSDLANGIVLILIGFLILCMDIKCYFISIIFFTSGIVYELIKQASENSKGQVFLPARNFRYKS